MEGGERWRETEREREYVCENTLKYNADTGMCKKKFNNQKCRLRDEPKIK